MSFAPFATPFGSPQPKEIASIAVLHFVPFDFGQNRRSLKSTGIYIFQTGYSGTELIYE